MLRSPPVNRVGRRTFLFMSIVVFGTLSACALLVMCSSSSQQSSYEVMANGEQVVPEQTHLSDDDNEMDLNETNDDNNNNNELSSSSFYRRKEIPSQCRIYLAPSSLKGVQGFGVYTTEQIPLGQAILQAPDGPSIPVYDFRLPKDASPDPERSNWVKVWDNYWWGRGVNDPLLHENYDSNDPKKSDIMDYQIMFGSLPNHHCILQALNFKWSTSSNRSSTNDHYDHFDDSLDLPHQSPGFGAYSYYSGRDFYASRVVHAGEEIFLSYGYCQRESLDPYRDELKHDINYPNHHPEWVAQSPMSEDYYDAGLIVQILYNEYNSTFNKESTAKNNSTLFENVYNRRVTRAIRNLRGSLTFPLISLLPKTFQQFMDIVNLVPPNLWYESDVYTKNDIEIEVLRIIAKVMNTNQRSVEWIKQNGFCLENIVPKPSTIPYAGHGAFTQFPIQKEEMVVPVPMLQIVNKDSLTILNNKAATGVNASTQLLINYCFGHHESTLLICPNSNAILINHCSNRPGFICPTVEGKPNADYRWAEWDHQTESWLQMPLDEMIEHEGRGISMEIYASRDIQVGEEIFIDYGEEWEKAWTQHVGKWNATKHAERLSVNHLNQQDGPLQFLVSGNLREDMFDEQIQTVCVFWFNDDHDYFDDDFNTKWRDLSDEEILELFSENGDTFDTDYAYHGEDTYFHCSVLRAEDDDFYTVRIYSYRNDSKETRPILLTNYPRKSIQYFYRPFQSDMHSLNSFRHNIGIRDDLFPQSWKNLSPSTSTN